MTVVSVIGLGAVGASYAARIVDSAPAVELRVIAEGARAQRLRSDGVTVNGTPYRFAVVEPGETVAPADLVIVAVKCHHLDLAIGQLVGHVGPGTVVLSLLNGITSEASLSSAFPEAYVPLSVCVGIDGVRHGGDVQYTTLGWVEVGDPVAGEPPAAVVQLAALLGDLGLTCRVRSDMVHALWWKFLVNVGVNQVTALLEAPYAVIQQPGPARDLVIAAQREVVAVAQAEGVGLSEADIERFLEVMATLGPGNYTSMAQDALAHRFTEVDDFAGTVVRLGERHGIATPVNAVLLQAFLAKHSWWGVA
jgi:2-dehydropantoate 2-reductase